METKKLHSILDIDGDSYEVNAVHSDAAAQVDNKLVINQVDLKGETNAIEFNGSTPQSISIVSSTGGAFTGPVIVKSLEESLEDLSKDLEDIESSEELEAQLAEAKKNLVINYDDISTIIQNLTGHPCLKWDGTELKTELTENGLTIQEVNLITGTLENYKIFIEQEEKPTFFLYICEDTGQIFFGLDSSSYKQLSTSSLKLVYEDRPTEGFTAEDLEEHDRLIREHAEKLGEGTDSILNQAKAYTDELKNGQVKTNTENINLLSDGINNINHETDGILAQAKAYTDELKNGQVKTNTANIQELDTDLTTKTTFLQNQISAVAQDIQTNRSDIVALQTGLSETLTTAKNDATTKVNKLKVDIKDGTVVAEKANSATSAIKATKDASGNTITSYYQKKIMVSSKVPTSSDGANGDIWIKY
jgi:hypothetical protein